MYRNKAARLSITNIRILTKLCGPSTISSGSAKPVRNFLRNLSTAAEKSDFINDSNGFGGENYVQAPSVWSSQESPERFHTGNVNGTTQNGSFSSGYVEYQNRNEYTQNPIGQNGNINSHHLGNYGHSWESSGGLNAGSYWGSQNGSAPQVVNNTEFAYTQQQQQHQTVHGHYGNANHMPQQSVGYHHLDNHPNVQMHQTGGTFNEPHRPGHYWNGNHRPQQSVGNYQFEGQPDSPIHQTSSALNEPYRPGNYFPGNSEGYQQQTSGTNYLNAGHSQWNSNELQNATVDPQVHQEEDDGSVKGTIEELDHFCKEGKIEEAIKVLGLLEQLHVSVDLPRYLSLMILCAENRALEEAKAVHENLMRSGIHLEVKTYNKVLEMYGKCGSMDDALAVFNQMNKRNITSWDRMITWYGRNGLGEDALELFTQFKETGWKPDSKIFLGVFSACGEVGDIIEGMLHFESMSKDYGIVPSMDHYVSVVKMMGSAGYLDEALEFIERMPIKPSVDVWKTLMRLCRIHGNHELGDRCTEIVEIIEPSFLDEQSRAGLIPITASDIAKEKRLKKSTSQSLLEARSRVHEYRAGDRSCPDHEKLYALLRGMRQQMKEAGYIAEVKFVLHDIDHEGKEEAIMAHSEKLAVARGLIDSPARASIRIIKNLRICGDCHSAMKIISKLVGRELIIRDAKRFHHFRDGLCSCRDYW
ncbi:unnamed protein product [Cuscuta epithymum]|uniref:DYW domain-containing protein n=1 Tax=Cuscuta epithymum TaxID=186058 RepID=A0AAV0CRR4_9ASTE|nr:unnamed protein product [Cuscuta epithymum]